MRTYAGELKEKPMGKRTIEEDNTTPEEEMSSY